jgi:hypothetical protein
MIQGLIFAVFILAGSLLIAIMFAVFAWSDAHIWRGFYTRECTENARLLDFCEAVRKALKELDKEA